MDEEGILRRIEGTAEEVVELTQRLVRYPSENWETHGGEGDCQRFVASWMRDVFDRVDVFTPTEVPGCTEHPAFWPGRDYSDRPNVVGTVEGTGEGRSLIFHGHIDVVPIEELPWHHAPYGAELEQDRIFGRGSLDQKGGLAAALIAAKALRRAGIRLAGDVIVESVVDEEYAGANGTVACIVRGYRAEAAISTEPSNMQVHRTNRSGRVYRIVCSGGNPEQWIGPREEAVFNPTHALARMVLALQELELTRNRSERTHPITKEIPWTTPVMIAKVKAGDVRPGGLLAIPPEAWLEAWIYGLPGITAEQLDREVMGFLEDWIAKDPFLVQHRPKIIASTRFLEPSSVPEDHPIVRTLARSIERVTGQPGIVKEGGSTSDAGILNNWGKTPTVTFGPGGGSAHSPDEYVNVPDLLALTRIYALQMASWCGVA
jgi:acetylornithine deacetylase